MKTSDATAILTPEPAWAKRAKAIRSYAGYCADMERDMRDRATVTEREITETYHALSRVRLATALFASVLVEEVKNLSMVATPDHPEDLMARIREAVCDGLGLTTESAHVLFDEQG
jgi:hypothetical protein